MKRPAPSAGPESQKPSARNSCRPRGTRGGEEEEDEEKEEEEEEEKEEEEKENEEEEEEEEEKKDVLGSLLQIY